MTGLIDALYKRILLAAHPVGSIYQSMVATSPAELFGGAWERIAHGRMLLGVGAIEVNNNNYWGTVTPGEAIMEYAGEMGGEVKHPLTIGEMPEHTHKCPFDGTSNSENFNWVYLHRNQTSNIYTTSNSMKAAGLSEPHNNMPPYLAVYMWKRTA